MSVLSAAKRGDSDALLRLYLLASGNVRTNSEYFKIKKNIAGFFKRYGSELSSEADQWKKGYLLNRAMHSYFFYNKQNDSSLNYEENQSRLSEVFKTGKFNCISSTLLYIHLSRKINLSVKAVVLPTHTFVEMKLNNGRKIEIETTSTTGFDWIHDRKFYKNVARNWFSERGLRASSFEDYQNREIIEPWLLTPLNMRNQHTNPARMNLKDRLRLQEFAAVIGYKDDKTLLSLLYVYNEFFIQSNKLSDKSNLKNLYDVSYTGIVDKMDRLVVIDKKLNEVAHWYFSQAAYIFLETGEPDRAKIIFLQHYSAIKKTAKENPNIFSNYAVVFNGLLKYYLKQKDYRSAENLIHEVNQTGIEGENWQQSILWYYSSKTKPLWENQDWTGIIQVWSDMKAQGLIWNNMEKFRKNIEGAYQNYSLKYEKQGNWKAAAEVLLRCTEDVMLASECMERLNKLNRQHNFF